MKKEQIKVGTKLLTWRGEVTVTAIRTDKKLKPLVVTNGARVEYYHYNQVAISRTLLLDNEFCKIVEMPNGDWLRVDKTGNKNSQVIDSYFTSSGRLVTK